jgi:hypothetical protein
MSPDPNWSEKQGDAVELPTLQQQVEHSLAECNRMLADVREHQPSIAKESTALPDLRAQFIRMRESVREWEKSLWDLRCRDTVPRNTSRAAGRLFRTLNGLLDEVIRPTFAFRKSPGEGAKS